MSDPPPAPMRLLVHDFGGYAFAIQLSRTLARRGHAVTHAYCGSLTTTPPGPLAPRPDDPASLRIRPLRLRHPLNKHAFVTRWRQEHAYGRLLAAAVARTRPDVVLSGNTPLDAQHWLLKACRALDIPSVFWLQDLISVATDRILQRKLAGPGALIGRRYTRLERALLRRSDAVVPITEAFRSLLHEWEIPDDRIRVIENWAPLDELPVRPRSNPWSQIYGLDDALCFLYAGTLGMKHDPGLLLHLARHLKRYDNARLVVVAQGPAADALRRSRDDEGLDTLLVLDFQPPEAVPDMLATADVLVAVLTPEAGAFSVPSKVLTYLCAGRPLLLAVPSENRAAHLVRTEEAGFVVQPDAPDAFLRAADALANDPDGRTRMGRNARACAERRFDIEAVTDAFEGVLSRIHAPRP